MGKWGFEKIAGTVFFVLVAGLSLHTRFPETPSLPSPIIKGLLAGSDRAYNPLGSEFSVFKDAHPAGNVMSFVMDYPFHRYGTTIEQIYSAQGLLAPVILNPQPDEKMAIIYCSDDATAARRMRETGYAMALSLGNGKGVGIKP